MLLRDILNPINLTSFIYRVVIREKLIHVCNRDPNIYSSVINDNIIDGYIDKVNKGRENILKGYTFNFRDMIDYVKDGVPQSCESLPNFRQILNDGSTVIIKDIGKFGDEGNVLHYLLRDLDKIFNTNYTLWCNLYISKGKNALRPHIDQHAIIVLQFKGRKEWDFFGKVNDWKTDKPVHKIMLNQGDLLYFPKWAPHVARTIPNVETGHATIELPSEYSKNAIYPEEWMMSQSEAHL